LGRIQSRRHVVKKLPVIGLIIAAVAAGWALLRRKKTEPMETTEQDTGSTTT
jgi:hypothetical protein